MQGGAGNLMLRNNDLSNPEYAMFSGEFGNVNHALCYYVDAFCPLMLLMLHLVTHDVIKND